MLAIVNPDSNPPAPLTVKGLSMAKGSTRTSFTNRDCEIHPEGVDRIPLAGRFVNPRQRLRTALASEKRFLWIDGEGPIVPYGLHRLEEAREQGVCSSSKVNQIVGRSGFASTRTRIPGAAMAGKIEADHIAGIPEIYFWREPDKAATRLRLASRRVCGRSDTTARYGDAGRWCEGPGELYQRDPASFDKAFDKAIAEATLVKSLVETEAVSLTVTPQRKWR